MDEDAISEFKWLFRDGNHSRLHEFFRRARLRPVYGYKAFKRDKQSGMLLPVSSSAKKGFFEPGTLYVVDGRPSVDTNNWGNGYHACERLEDLPSYVMQNSEYVVRHVIAGNVSRSSTGRSNFAATAMYIDDLVIGPVFGVMTGYRSNDGEWSIAWTIADGILRVGNCNPSRS